MATKKPALSQNRRARSSGWKWVTLVLLLLLIDLVFVLWWRRNTLHDDSGWLDRMNRGQACLEQFDYKAATHQYEQALAIKPEDLATRINLGIALLNQAEPEPLDKAVELLRGVIAERPDDPFANYSLGMILQYRNDLERALPLFEVVTRSAPEDAHAWYQVGKCLSELDLRPHEAYEALKKAVDLEPALNAARYALAMHPDTPLEARKSMLDEQRALADAIWEREYKIRYGDMGPHAEAVPLPGVKPLSGLKPLPFMDVAVELAAGTSWRPIPLSSRAEADVLGRQGRVTVVLDRLGEGIEELLLLGAVVRNGLPGNLLLSPRGNGWLEVTAEAGLSQGFHWVAAAGDLDNDGRPDLVLAGPDGLRALKNNPGGKFTPLEVTAGKSVEAGLFGSIALVDIDQDGDLDILAGRFDTTGSDGLAAWWNISEAAEADAGKPAEPLKLKFELRKVPGALSPGAVAGLTVADVDGDGDLDLVLLPWAEGRPVWVRNDRLSRFMTLPVGGELFPIAKWQSCMAFLGDLWAPPKLVLSRVKGEALGATWSTSGWSTNEMLMSGAMQLLRLDLDLDGQPDLVALGNDGVARYWSRPGREETGLDLGNELDGIVPLQNRLQDGITLVGWKRGQGLKLIGLDLAGRHSLVVRPTGLRKTGDSLRSTAESVGTRVGVFAGPFRGWDEVGTGQSAGQSSRMIRLGTGPLEFAQALRLRWPDGVPQAEMDPPVDQRIVIEEKNRKGTSCPILFVEGKNGWEFVTDCLGPGALGEQGPDSSVRPARPVETLRLPTATLGKHGTLRLRLAEPMDEVMYLDGARVAVVDHPVGTEIWADERFNFTGPAPTSNLMVVGNLATPNLATDTYGGDALKSLGHADGLSVSNFPRTSWLGMAAWHALDLRFASPGGLGPLVLCAEGGVDYPYPESIIAAAQAGVDVLSPSLSQKGANGIYQPLGEIGFPAGLPKAMLARIPEGAKPGEAWRLEGNLRVYWDRLRLGRLQGDAEKGEVKGVTVRWLDPTEAKLDRVGFAREVPRGPLVGYDGKVTESVSVSSWLGRFTRLGDVAELVASVDDKVVVCGPGEAVDLGYVLPADAPALGMTRTLLLRVHGWCKDTAPTTLAGARVEPLPWRGMPAYPCPLAPGSEAWSNHWNTRSFR